MNLFNLIAFASKRSRNNRNRHHCTFTIWGEKLPELARGIGKASGEFKKAQNEFKHSLEAAEEEAIKDESEKESSSSSS